MKYTTTFKVVAAITVVLLGLNAFAATIKLSAPATVNGKQVPAGEYNVKLTSSGADAEATFFQGKKAVVTAKGRLEDRSYKAPYDAFVVNSNGDGSQSVIEIDFAGKKQVLVLGESGASMEAGKQ